MDMNENTITLGEWESMSFTAKRLFIGGLEDGGVDEARWPAWLAKEADELREQWNSEITDRWEGWL